MWSFYDFYVHKRRIQTQISNRAFCENAKNTLYCHFSVELQRTFSRLSVSVKQNMKWKKSKAPYLT